MQSKRTSDPQETTEKRSLYNFDRRDFVDIVKTNDVECVRQIIENTKAKIGGYRKNGFPGNLLEIIDAGLRTAVECGYAEIAEYLLQHGANTYSYYHQDLQRRVTYLEVAITSGRLQLAEVLIRHGGARLVKEAILNAARHYHEVIEKLTATINFKYFSAAQIAAAKVELQEQQQKFKLCLMPFMDYAQSVNFEEKEDVLQFLACLADLAGMNFVGVSYQGKPITLELLRSWNFNCADQAVVSLTDLNRMHDKERASMLLKRTNAAMKEFGTLIENDVVNLVPLLDAVAANDKNTVLARLTRGAKPVDKTIIPNAIKIAAENGYKELVDLLFEYQAVNQRNEDGATLLHTAIMNGNIEQVIQLLNVGADCNLYYDGISPLMLAIQRVYDSHTHYRRSKPSANHIEIARILLARGANPDAVTSTSVNVLDIAATAGSAAILALLVPVVDKRDRMVSNILSPWYLKVMSRAADSRECLEILKILREAGADFNHRLDNGSLLLGSVMHLLNDVRASAWNFNEDCEIAGSKQPEQWHLYTCDQYMKFTRIIDFLLEAGVNPAMVSAYDGGTAVHELFNVRDLALGGIPNGYARIIDKCLARGFDINSKDKYGRTVLHLAVRARLFEAVKYLIANGADVNAQDNDGMTPLHNATVGDLMLYCPRTSPKIMQYLLQKGASASVANHRGEIPAQYAASVLADKLAPRSGREISAPPDQDAMNAFASEFEHSITLLRPQQAVLVPAVVRQDALTPEVIAFHDKCLRVTSAASKLSELVLSEEDFEALAVYCDYISDAAPDDVRFKLDADDMADVDGDGVPRNYICPISRQIMHSPVTCLLDNKNYDEHYIKNTLALYRSSPITRAAMQEGQAIDEILVRNPDLQNRIRAFIKLQMSHIREGSNLLRGRIFVTPVMLNGRIYDLETLTSLPERQRTDPVTGRAFLLSDIKPAPHVLSDLEFICGQLQQKHIEAAAEREKVRMRDSYLQKGMNLFSRHDTAAKSDSSSESPENSKKCFVM